MPTPRPPGAYAVWLLIALVGLSVPCRAFAADSPNPYLEPAARLYRSLEFQAALRTIEKALAWPTNSQAEEVKVALLEGLITAQLGDSDRAIGAFERALALDPAAQLPFKVSPKLSKLFEKARLALAPTHQAAPTAATPPAKPAPVPESRPQAVVAAPPPAPPLVQAPEANVVARSSVASSGGLLLGAAGYVNTLGLAWGSEAFAGYRGQHWQLSARCRPGTRTGVGALVAFEGTAGPLQLSAGLRGDLYLGGMIPGGGLVLGARKSVVGPLGVVVLGSVEAFAANAAAYRPLAVVVSAGLDFRP